MRQPSLLLASLAGVSLISSGAASGGSCPDDVHFIPGPLFDAAFIGAGSYAAQTFTVGMPGTLESVGLLLFGSYGPDSVRVEIRRTVSGLPSNDPADVLGYDHISGYEIHGDTPRWGFANLAAFSIRVHPGDVLAVVAGAEWFVAFDWIGQVDDPYPGGRAYRPGADPPWHPIYEDDLGIITRVCEPTSVEATESWGTVKGLYR